MTLTPTLEKYLPLSPETKREADLMACRLFGLFAFLLVGLITVGIL